MLRTQEKYEFDLWVIHECYSIKELLRDDIALLRLKNPVKSDGKTKGTICLPPCGKKPISYDMTLIGWGIQTETHSYEEEGDPDLLQKTQTKTVSEEFCDYYFYYKNIGIIGRLAIKGKKLCFRGDATTCRVSLFSYLLQIASKHLIKFIFLTKG